MKEKAAVLDPNDSLISNAPFAVLSLFYEASSVAETSSVAENDDLESVFICSVCLLILNSFLAYLSVAGGLWRGFREARKQGHAPAPRSHGHL